MDVALSLAAARRRAAWAAVRVTRPRQWTKNVFVLAPLVFAGRAGDALAVREAAWAFVLFSLAAACGYIVNDLLDRERDALHPVRRVTRPVAAGELSPRTASWVLAGVGAMLVAGLVPHPRLWVPVGAYLALALAYSAALKHVPVVEQLCVAGGFLLRVYGGARAIPVPLSGWMAFATLFLALYLASLKRWHESVAQGSTARPVLRAYSAAGLRWTGALAGASAAVSYLLYVAVEHPELALTIPLVLAGLARFWSLSDPRRGPESPTDALLLDVPLALIVVSWGALCLHSIMR